MLNPNITLEFVICKFNVVNMNIKHKFIEISKSSEKHSSNGYDWVIWCADSEYDILNSM